MADVFPKDSIQDKCRLNISSTYNTAIELFARGSYELPTDNLLLFNDVASFMTSPYGITFNCFYSVNNVFFSSGPVDDGSFTSSLILIN